MQIRETKREDLLEVVRVHQLAFQGFLMTLLGPKFLYTYYKLVFEYPLRVFLVLTDDGDEVKGFVAGFLEPNRFYERLRRKKIKLALAALVHIFLHPTLLTRVWHNFLKIRSIAKGRQHVKKVAELASIALEPSCAGQGFGKQLVLAFLNRAHEMGAQKVYLTTDALDNDAVNVFYRQLGFNLKRKSIVTGNKLRNEYVYSLEGRKRD